MTVTVHVSLKDLPKRIEMDIRAKERAVQKGLRKAAKQSLNYIRKNTMPVAFGDLREKAHIEPKSFVINGTIRVVFDAPYACAIEVGSRPHMPPVEPIIKWVKLRGAQGLTGRKAQGTWLPSDHLTGSTSLAHASRVSRALQGYEHDGGMDINAPKRIAWAIATAIKKHGTKPQWFVRSALPQVHMIVDTCVREAFYADSEPIAAE